MAPSGETRLVAVQPDTVRKRLRLACAELGIPRHGTHGFRHRFAQDALARLRAQGLPAESAERQVAELLGHGRRSALRPYCGD